MSWGCTENSNTQIIRRLKKKLLRKIVDAPWLMVSTELWENGRVPNGRFSKSLWKS